MINVLTSQHHPSPMIFQSQSLDKLWLLSTYRTFFNDSLKTSPKAEQRNGGAKNRCISLPPLPSSSKKLLTTFFSPQPIAKSINFHMIRMRFGRNPKKIHLNPHVTESVERHIKYHKVHTHSDEFRQRVNYCDVIAIIPEREVKNTSGGEIVRTKIKRGAKQKKTEELKKEH